MNTIIVVPCYNEAKRLDVENFVNYLRQAKHVRLLFVNDGSRDRTIDVLRDLERVSGGRALVLDLPQNVGKAEAVRKGFLAAFRHRPDAIGFWDADLATPLDEIPRFRDVLTRQPSVQMVIGTRLPLLGRRIERRWRRHLAGRLFARTASTVLGLRIYDTQCGAKLFRYSSELEAAFSQPFQSRWIFDVEILARLSCPMSLGRARLAEAVFELPLESWQDVAGSKLKSSDFAKAAFELFNIYRTYGFGHTGQQSGRPEPVETFADESPWVVRFPSRDIAIAKPVAAATQRRVA